MFNLEFFKGKIDTTKIHNLTPPIDPEVVDSINIEIKENNQNDSELSKTDDEPKFYKYQIFHDGTAYEGEWLNYRRHGKGTEFKHSTNNTPVKTYQGQWKDNERSGYGTSFKICNDNTSVKVYQGYWRENKLDKKGTFFDGDDSLAVEHDNDRLIIKY